MSQLLQELRTRVDALVKPHREVYGDDAPTVRMALLVLAEAEDIERQLGERKVSTAEASERTGWSVETLQKYARMKLAGDPLPPAWAGLIVEAAGAGYAFVLGSIPEHPRAGY